jgi:hypothetical protein
MRCGTRDALEFLKDEMWYPVASESVTQSHCHISTESPHIYQSLRAAGPDSKGCSSQHRAHTGTVLQSTGIASPSDVCVSEPMVLHDVFAYYCTGSPDEMFHDMIHDMIVYQSGLKRVHDVTGHQLSDFARYDCIGMFGLTTLFHDMTCFTICLCISPDLRREPRH